MTQFARTIVTLSGFDGAPGVNVFNWCAPAHGDITQEYVDSFNETLDEAFTALTTAFFASGVIWTIEPGVSVHEVDDGELVNAFTDGGGPYTATGTGGPNLSRATQAGMRLLTADFRGGRRVQGRSFLGPLGAGQIANDGTLGGGAVTLITDAFEGVIDPIAPRLIVWSRPGPNLAVGQYADVTQVRVAPTPFVLRGRRD